MDLKRAVCCKLGEGNQAECKKNKLLFMLHTEENKKYFSYFMQKKLFCNIFKVHMPKICLFFY